MRTPPLSPALFSLNLPLPRPPAWIWLFTTQIGPGSVFAAASESAARNTGAPREIGTPKSCSNALAWYSWIFMWTLPEPWCGEFGFHRGFATGIPYTTKTANLKSPSNFILLVLSRFQARAGIAASQKKLERRGSMGPIRRLIVGAQLLAEQIGRDLLAGIDQALHRADRLVEGFAVLAGQLDLDDALDALRADHDGHADIHVLHAVFAVEIGRAGQHALLVAQIALGHRDRGCRRRVECRAGLQWVDDLGAAVAGAIHDLVDARLRGPAHLDEGRQLDAGNGGIIPQRHHVGAMAAQRYVV